MEESVCQPPQVWYLCQLTIAILSLSCIIGVFGNALVLWMATFRMARTVTTVWFFNLALADLTILLFLPISIYTMANGWWPSANLPCKLYMAFLNLNFFVSIYTLVLISVDRCILVLHPVWARNHRSVQRAIWLVVAVWLLATAACSPHFRYRAVAQLGQNTYCYFEFNLSHTDTEAKAENVVALRRQMVMAAAQFLVGFLVPLAIIGTCAHLIRSKLGREGWVYAGRPKRLLVVLVSTFFILWFPFNLAFVVGFALLLWLQQVYIPVVLPILWVTFSLGCFSSCLNPFLYVFIGRDFKERFFHSLPSALARAFGDEGFITHPGPEAKAPGDDGNLAVETRSPTS